MSAPPRSDLSDADVLTAPSPSRDDPTVARASRLIGGPWGRYAAPGSWWTPLKVLLALMCLTLVLGFLEKAPCATGAWSHNLQYSHSCYSDIIPLWSAERLDVGAVPYRDQAVEYPVLTGAFMWGTATITRGLASVFNDLPQVELFGFVNDVLLAVCALLAVWFTAGAAGRRRWDVAIFALSPLVVFHAFSNWDLLAMMLASGGLWAWARGRPVASGFLIGLGTAAKLYPVLLLLPLLILAVRTRRYREAAWACVAAAVAWLAVNIPVAAAYYSGWREFYHLSAVRPAEASTVWYMGNDLATVGFGTGYAPSYVPPGAAVALLLLAALGAVTFAGLRAPVKPRIGQLAFLAVLAFLLTTKVWSPQYSIWLVPLVALARPRWRVSLLWQCAEVLVWIMTMEWLLGFNDNSHGVDYGWLMLVLVIRDALLVVIAGLVIREMFHPELDVVRAGAPPDVADPAGGIFNGLPDLGGSALLERAGRRRWSLPDPD